MAPKIFMTGATGYIGGDVLFELSQTHPDWNITALVRNSAKGANVAQSYPRVTLVYGDLDSADLIEEEASKADIVYHCADCDHISSAKAISRGLARSLAPTSSFWIHTSGAAIILANDSPSTMTWGSTFSKVYNDWDGVTELTSLPDSAHHRPVDKVVLAASSSVPVPEKVKTAIVCPPLIWGRGRGPGNTRSIQAYDAARLMLRMRQAFVVGKGENKWNEVHVEDLSKLYVLLGEAAVNGGPPATWNEKGYYLAENGEVIWGELMREMAKEAYSQGLLESQAVKTLSEEEANELKPYLAAIIGSESRGESIRGKRLLGWTPSGRKIKDEVRTIVMDEAMALGLIKSHTENVAA